MRLVDANALIDAIDEIDWYHLNNNGEMVHGANSDDHQPWYKSDDIYKAIRRAPTVDAPAWIPVKERIPIERQDCLVTYIVKSNAEPGFTWRLMGCATFVPDLFNWADYYELRSPIKDGISYGWITYDDEDGRFYRQENVVAWMPLPNPYKEEE
jgi:hypothetical protein